MLGLLVELDTLDNMEEDIQGNSLAKELQEVDTLGLVHLAHQGGTQEEARALQEEAILQEATLTPEQQEHPQAHHLVDIQAVHLEVTQVRRLQASKGPILELLLRLLTLRWSSGSAPWTRTTRARSTQRSSDKLLPTGTAACSVRRRAGQ